MEKNLHCDIDLDQTMPNVELVRAIFMQHVQVSSILNHYILSYRTYRVHVHRHRQTATQPGHTAGHTHNQTDMSTL